MHAGQASRPLQLLRVLATVLVIAGTAVALIWGFLEARNGMAGEPEGERAVRAPLRVSKLNGEPVITLDASTQRRNGIETAMLAPASYQEEVRAYGMVLDLTRLTDLSNSYATAKAQLQTAEAKLGASRADVERSRMLYQGRQAISQKQLQAAEAVFGTDDAAVAAAMARLRTLIASAHQEWGPVLSKSLIDDSPLVNRLIERQDFLVQITLPPGVSIAKPPVSASIEAAKGVRAPISYVSAATRTDPRIQSASFFYIIPAESGVLPGMNVLAFLPTGTMVEGVVVPTTAIVWWQDRAWVYRRGGPETFARVGIATDRLAPGEGFAVNNLPKDTEIVTRGAQLLLSEEFRAQIQVGGDQR